MRGETFIKGIQFLDDLLAEIFHCNNYRIAHMRGDVVKAGAMRRQNLHGDGCWKRFCVDEVRGCEWLVASAAIHDVAMEQAALRFIGR